MTRDEKPSHAAIQEGVNSSRTETTIAALTKLLESTVAAEELKRTWQRSKGETLQDSGPRLQDLRRAIDSGKVIKMDGTASRGVPMWIMVRMCKATWHQDGTWPLLGADEEIPPAMTSSSPVSSLIRSIHPSSELLRPPGLTTFNFPTVEDENHTALKPEPSAEDIAATYRKRGIAVEEAVQDDLADW